MNLIKACMAILLLTITICAQSLPYYVDPNLLLEVDENLEIYQQHPSSNEAIFNLSMSYAYTGQVKKGWELLKTLPPSYADEVVSHYTALKMNNPDEWKYPFKLAFGLFFQKKKIEAIETFKEVIKLDPDNVWAYGYIALIYGEMNNADDTLVYCKKALAIEKNATAIYLLQAEAYRRKKKYFKGLKSFVKFSSLAKKHKKKR